MGNLGATIRDSGEGSDYRSQPERCPGLALVFSCGRPAATVISLAQGAVALGRGTHGPAADARMSRRHARVSFDGNRFWVTDLGSQNGTSCDGKPIPPNQATEVQRLIRMGDSLFGVFRDVLPMSDKGVQLDGEMVLGPALQGRLQEVKPHRGSAGLLGDQQRSQTAGRARTVSRRSVLPHRSATGGMSDFHVGSSAPPGA